MKTKQSAKASKRTAAKPRANRGTEFAVQRVVSRRGLAEKIAAHLFVNGSGERAQRLVLELKGGRYGGGWAEPCVVDVIEHELKAANDQAQRRGEEA